MIIVLILLISSFWLYSLSRYQQLPFLGELAISFLPYWGILALIGLIISLIALGTYIYKKPNHPSKLQKYALYLVICFFLVFLLYSSKLNNFYQPNSTNTTTQKKELKVLFGNIYKGNTEYESLKNLINQEQPDVVLFVEFSDQHKEAFESFLKQDYPYINRTTRSRIMVGSVVFSKYPIENLADDFPQGSRRYGYFLVKKDNTPYYFYEIHTSSPTSKESFYNRNLQLQKLSKEITETHAPSREQEASVIMLGDFNITPRSPYYQNFIQQLPKDWWNATQKLPPFFSRKLGTMLNIHEDFATLIPQKLKKLTGTIFNIFAAHIDHLFSNHPENIQELKVIHLPGSDHKGFVFSISS